MFGLISFPHTRLVGMFVNVCFIFLNLVGVFHFFFLFLMIAISLYTLNQMNRNKKPVMIGMKHKAALMKCFLVMKKCKRKAVPLSMMRMVVRRWKTSQGRKNEMFPVFMPTLISMLVISPMNVVTRTITNKT